MKKKTTADKKVVIVGVGGAGNNTVNRLSRQNLGSMKILALNTDRSHFKALNKKIGKMLIGKKLLKGKGTTGDPIIGMKAAEEDNFQIGKRLLGARLVFLCAGLGGGTGTGASPIIAKIAKGQKANVIAIVSYPFALEKMRCNQATEGLRRLKESCDGVIVIPNDMLARLFPHMDIEAAFNVVDKINSSIIHHLSTASNQYHNKKVEK